MFYYLNNRIVPAEEALVTVRDISILRGFGIFDYFRTHHGKPFLMDDYLYRFKNSVQLTGLSLWPSIAELRDLVLELIELNQLPESGIRLVLTGGDSPDSFLPASPVFAIMVEKFRFANDELYNSGAKLITYHYQREFSEIKTTNYLTSLMLRGKIKQEGAMDVLYHHNGELRECSRCNIFLIRNRTIATPGKHILYGVTRKKTIELAKHFYPVEERAVKLDEIKKADECFITGTTKRILPVVNIDGIMIGSGMPGRITRHLMEMFHRYETEN